MCAKLAQKGVPDARIVTFPNWVDTGLIRPIEAPNALREELGIHRDTRVVLYSGNMGEKQGLEIILDVARSFVDPGVLFLLCGDGAVRIVELQRSGGKPMPAVEFLRGTSVAPGLIVQ